MGSIQSPLSLRVMPAASGAWPRAEPAAVPLRSREVQVWAASLAGTATDMADAARLLSEAERERAARFRFDHHRRRFILARALLRRLIAVHLRCPPEAVELAIDARGKPSVSGPTTLHDFGLNLSHSGDTALIAIALGRRVGVDVEESQRRVSVEEMSPRVLTARERARLAGKSGEALALEFLRCWTRKEAWIKALGEGLARDLQSFEVLERTGAEGAAAETPTGERWWLQDLTPGAHAVGCVAVEGDDVDIRLLAWT
jgi:4'-phosphopantetheinyl transferase